MSTVRHVGSAVKRRAVGVARRFTGPDASALDPELHPVDARRVLAEWYLSGDGIEIGALHQPLVVPSTAKVRYVDRCSVDVLRQQYPELSGFDLVEVDIEDDGETLGSIADSSLDFVIANHFLEHCGDPIGALESMLRVLRKDGVVYCAVPDKRFTFDEDRSLTTIEHLLADHREGPAVSRHAHFLEWAELVDKKPVEEVEAHAARLAADDYSIHYHVFDFDTILEFVKVVQAESAHRFVIECCLQNGFESVLLLRRVSRLGAIRWRCRRGSVLTSAPRSRSARRGAVA